MRKYNQMKLRQILDSQIKYKNNSQFPIPLEPHLEQGYFGQNDDCNYFYLNKSKNKSIRFSTKKFKR